MDDILQTALRDAGLDFFSDDDHENEPVPNAADQPSSSNNETPSASVPNTEEPALEACPSAKPAESVAKQDDGEGRDAVDGDDDIQIVQSPGSMVRNEPDSEPPEIEQMAPPPNVVKIVAPNGGSHVQTRVVRIPSSRSPMSGYNAAMASPVPGDAYPSPKTPSLTSMGSHSNSPVPEARVAVSDAPPAERRFSQQIVARPISQVQLRKASVAGFIRAETWTKVPTVVRRVDGPRTAVLKPELAYVKRDGQPVRQIRPIASPAVVRIPVSSQVARRNQPVGEPARVASTVRIAPDGTRTLKTYSFSRNRPIELAPVARGIPPGARILMNAPKMHAQQAQKERMNRQVNVSYVPETSGYKPEASCISPSVRVVGPLSRSPSPANSVRHPNFVKPLVGAVARPITTAATSGSTFTPPPYANRMSKPLPVVEDSKPEPAAPLDIDDEEDRQAQADTFIEYKPLKLRSGCEHPDSVVETASLSAVSSPEIRYHMSVPEEVIDSGKISALQLEAALYACQAHERVLPSGDRMGYLIGDGAGVGKGRTIATIIYENYLIGRKRALWFSVSSDLYYDALRDLRDIGADIEVHQLNTMRYAKLNSEENGFVKKGVIFATYSSLICEARHRDGKGTKANRINSRLQQLVQWCGEGFDGPIIFDECHHAKNLVPTAGSKPTKTGRYVLELQKSLPNARVVYASATGATEPRNMAYMTRLGLWGERQTFPTFSDFIHAVEDRGVGAMEMVAMDMKLRGLYLARQLSFKGVAFSVEEVQLEDDFVKLYDESVKMWMECRRQFQLAIDLLKSDERNERTVWAQFWSAHQRFFKYLCIGAKVNACVAITKDALANGKCVVIGLQSTGEAQTLGVLEDAGEITDFVSTTKAVLQNLIEKHFPTGDSDGMDVLGDIGRMFAVGGGGLPLPIRGEFNRKRRQPFSIDRMQPPAKRAHKNSTGSVNEDERSSNAESEGDEEKDSDVEDEDEEDSESSMDDEDETDDDDEDEQEDEDEEEEEASDSQEEAKPSPQKTERKKNDSLFDTLMDELDNSYVPDVDPFNHDFSSTEDPWAHLQNFQEDQSDAEEKRLKEVEEEKKRRLEERRRKRKLRKKRRLRREKKEREEAKRKEREMLEKRRVENASNAKEFMQSTKVIDESPRDQSSLLMVKTELLAAVERLGRMLPPNTLDQLIDDLGGPEHVAEMTGRRGRIVVQPNGQAEYQLRNANSMAPVELMNLEEKEKFMNGEKLVAVISEAASSGISLQSDKRVPNKRRRVHITLELPWSADKAVQQFGRTHRSNQQSAPEYLFLISELAGEKRFASVVAKRLECLGALTHGDRRATESRDLSQFNLDNRYGREALQIMIRTLANPRYPPFLPAPSSYKVAGANFFDDMREYLVGVGVLSKNPNNPTGVLTIEKEGVSLSKFLNRLLGLPVHAQNALFGYFTDIINALIKKAKQEGTFDKGIVDLGAGTDRAKKMEGREFRGMIDNSNFLVEMHKIGADRGIKFEDAMRMFEAQQNDPENVTGFYLTKPVPTRKSLIVLITNHVKRASQSLGNNYGTKVYSIMRPNTGRSLKTMNADEVAKKFTRIPASEAKAHWEEEYEMMGNMCLHRYMAKKCKTEDNKSFCEIGRRFRTYFVLTGSVIAVWPVLEKALQESRPKNSPAPHLQTVRIQTDDKQKLVGLLVLPQNVKAVLIALQKLVQ